MPTAQTVAKPSLAYAKIVATPTETSWSQVYNAGSLFACLSLSNLEPDSETALPTVGKEIVNNLEAEFFTLEDKTLDTIREAIKNATTSVPPAVSTNICLAYFKDTLLYLFIKGSGKVVMKRDGKIGVLLEQTDNPDEIITASGYLQNADNIVLQTKEFADSVSDKELDEALELSLPNDIAETLSPQIHEKGGGSQSAIIVAFHGVTKPPVEDELDPDTFTESAQSIPQHEVEEETKPESVPERKPIKFFLPTLPKLPSLPLPKVNLSHKRKLMLSIVVVLIILLIVSITLTKKKQQSSQTSALFQQTISQAQRYYDDGKGLESLNKSLSHDDFVKAEKILKDGQKKFLAGSNEQKQISDLLAKVEAELGPATVSSVPTKIASLDTSDILSIEKANSDGLSFGQDDNSVYMITAKEITSIDKSTGKKKTIITNDNDWSSPAAVIPYQGNIYLLDQRNGVLKFVPAGSGYDKSSYFKGTAPDLSKAKAMAIDGSVWIVLSDGTILKYTKGQADTFKVSALDKPLSNPTKIFTNLDLDNLYVLDTGNSRVVKLAKNGSFQSQYAASIISQAKDFEVNEKDKKIYILSGDKAYEIAL